MSSTPQAHDIPLYTHTHLHHRKVPIKGCDGKTAAAGVGREEEEVVAALLDKQLW